MLATICYLLAWTFYPLANVFCCEQNKHRRKELWSEHKPVHIDCRLCLYLQCLIFYICYFFNLLQLWFGDPSQVFVIELVAWRKIFHKLAAVLIRKQFRTETAICKHPHKLTLCVLFSVLPPIHPGKEKRGQLESNETAISYDKLSLDTKNSI